MEDGEEPFQYFMVWQAKGELRKYLLVEGEYYLGRPMPEDLPHNYDIRDRYTVYIIPVRGRPYSTDIVSPFVSRRHLKIVVGKNNISIINHGPRGEGTKNPTYVDTINLGIKRNSLSIEECRTLYIRLGFTGPSFTITCGSRGMSIITLLPGAPIELPTKLAKELVNSGMAVEVYNKGDTSIIMASGLSKRTLEMMTAHGITVRVTGTDAIMEHRDMIARLVSSYAPEYAGRIDEIITGLARKGSPETYVIIGRLYTLGEIKRNLEGFLSLINTVETTDTRVEPIISIISELDSITTYRDALREEPGLIALYEDFLETARIDPRSAVAVETAEKLVASIDLLMRRMVRKLVKLSR
ncbi:MAG: FHA domain-containing protein [Desulfurococcales archaeon]|nr:FHA domain-containing protein [Desulfurococcales archaeon]